MSETVVDCNHGNVNLVIKWPLYGGAHTSRDEPQNGAYGKMGHGAVTAKYCLSNWPARE